MDTSDIWMSHLKELGVLTVVQAKQVLLHLKKKELESWKKYPYGLFSFFKFWERMDDLFTILDVAETAILIIQFDREPTITQLFQV